MSFTSEFETLLNKKRKKERSKIGLFNAYSQELAAKEPQDSKRIEIFQDPEGENVVKSILGTAGEAVVDTAQGFMGFSEGIADWIGHNVIYPLRRAAGETENDLKGYRRDLNASTTQKVLGGVDAALDKHSVLGHTSDAVFQGVGQFIPMVAGGKALQAAGWGATAANLGIKSMMGVSAMGSAQSEAYAGGATDGEALAYGAASAGSELLFESLFGGMGKALNMVGFSKGLSSLDDIAAKGIAKFISSPTGKNVAQMLVKGGFEGLEEVGTGFAQAVAKKLTYMSEEEFGKILKDENLFEQFFVGALVSDMAQAGDVRTANKAGTDLVTGLTQNEQKVIDKEVENRVTQEEKGGKKLSGKEKSAIYEQVVRDMERGYISTETIESVLGKDALTQYDTLSKEAEEFKTLYETEGGKLSEKQKDRLAELKEKNKANPYEELLKSQRAKISKDVSALAQSDRLGESYREQTRKGEKFQADVSKYSEAQRKTVQNAIDSGILNNTNRSHEFVDLIAKISADKGISFDFADNAKLKESGFALDGVLVNGFVNENGVTINIQSAKALNRVVGHEITHVLEGTQLYDALQSAVTEYAKGKKEYDSRLKELTELYEGKNANVEQELVADLVGDYLFTDADFIKHLSTEHRNLAQKIYDEIKYLCKTVTAGTKEARQLEKVKKAFADAYRAETKNPTKDGGVRFSFGVTQADIDTYVDNAYANQNSQDYRKYAEVSEKLCNDVQADINLNGYAHALRDNDIRHIRNSHGENTQEKYPVTKQDIKNIPWIVENYDKVYTIKRNDGRTGIMYVKVNDQGTVYYLEQVTSKYGNEPLLVNKQMIKTGIDDIPDLPGLIDAITKKQSETEFLNDLKEAQQVYAQSVYQSHSINKITQPGTDVKQQNSLSKKDFSIAPPVGADVHGKDIGYDIAPPVPESVLRANKARPKVGDPAYAPVRKDIPPKVANSKGRIFSDPSDPNFAPPTQKTIAHVLDVEPKTAQQKKNRLWALTKANVLDKGAVFEDLSLQTKNRELMGKWNYILSSEARAQYLIGHGADGVKALNDIREQVINSGKTKEFYEYLYHRLNVDRMTLNTRYKGTDGNPAKNKPVFGDTVTAEISQSTIRQYEEQFPEFKEFAQDVYDYMNHLRKLMINSGLISQKTADLWSEMYPSYVPVRRAGKEGNAVNVSLYTGHTSIKSAKGDNSDILPLFDTMALRTIQTYKAIAKNNFGVELKNSLNSSQQITEETVDDATDGVDDQNGLLQAGTINKNPTFTVFENGQKVSFEITEDMYDALAPVSGLLAQTSKILNSSSNFHRGLLTEYNPVFMLTNAIKDVQDVLINSQHPAKTYFKIPEAFSQICSKGYWYQEYIANGGAQNTYFDKQSKTFAEETKGIKVPLEKISRANGVVETTPRLAEYIASREAGRSVEVSMLDAARVTTNFAAGGDVTKFLNRNGATFLNASVQGLMQNVRNIREANAKGLKGWVALAGKCVLAAVPGLLLNNLLWDDDEDYEELSDYVKQNYYVIAKYADGQFVRIPKGRVAAVIQDAAQQVVNATTGNDEADLENFVQLAINNLAPNNPVEDNILAPILQVAANETWYGGDLVPERLQDMPAAEQFDESTDKFSKWLGEKLNISPTKIHYLLDQYSGGVGDVVLPFLTPEAESNLPGVAKVVAPIVDKFTSDSVMENQNVTDFYDLKDELTTKANSAHATDEDILRSKFVNSVSNDIADLYKQKREIQNSDLPDSEKYAKVRQIQKDIDVRTADALKNCYNVTIDGDYATVGHLRFRKNKKGIWQKISDG